jgi:alpha-1,3-fucosyltransferase 10
MQLLSGSRANTLRMKPPGEAEVLILFYNSFFDSYPAVSSLNAEIQGLFATDRSLYDRADAVVFHIPDLTFGAPSLEDVAALQKPSRQLWVAWSMESSVNYPALNDPALMNRFDLVMSFRQSADIWTSYCPSKDTWLRALEKPVGAKTAQAPLVMFQSSGFNKSARTEFTLEIMQELQVDSFGRHLNNKQLCEDWGRETKLETISRYKFCLALENAIEDDYVTEKFFDPLLVGVVPVYRGAPNVADFAPGKRCFINTEDFASVPALVAYLKYLIADEREYEAYLKWREAPLLPLFEERILKRLRDPFTELVMLLRNRDKQAASR